MDSQNSSSSFLSAHLPITFLGIAFSLYFLTQMQEAGIEADGLKIQETATAKLTESLQKQHERNEKELKDREALVAASEKIQQQFASESQTVKDKTTSAAQFEQLHNQIAELNKLLEQRKPLVEQSQQVQQQFTDLMKDLDTLARVNKDADADMIIKTYGIQINDTTGKKPEGEKPVEKK